MTKEVMWGNRACSEQISWSEQELREKPGLFSRPLSLFPEARARLQIIKGRLTPNGNF
ncbi:MAG: hypothetical protein K0R57_3200 [Paenibacillaceae bacterium]|nr:hypothetical protein [Paenibacillaceae bacterium]